MVRSIASFPQVTEFGSPSGIARPRVARRRNRAFAGMLTVPQPEGLATLKDFLVDSAIDGS